MFVWFNVKSLVSINFALKFKKRDNAQPLHKTFCRSSHSEVLCVLKNFAKLHLCKSFFFNKAEGVRPATLIKETLAQMFSCEFCKISKNTFSYRTPQVPPSSLTTKNQISIVAMIVFWQIV